jgi:hypothetical protein
MYTSVDYALRVQVTTPGLIIFRYRFTFSKKNKRLIGACRKLARG